MTEPHRDLTIFGEADDKTVEQMYNCLDVQSGSKGVLCADNHLGYAQPVGGVVAYRNRISVSGVGYDIGCGNKAVETNLLAADVDIAGVMDEIERRVAFGIGPNPGEKAPDHPASDLVVEDAAHARRYPGDGEGKRAVATPSPYQAGHRTG